MFNKSMTSVILPAYNQAIISRAALVVRPVRYPQWPRAFARHHSRTVNNSRFTYLSRLPQNRRFTNSHLRNGGAPANAAYSLLERFAVKDVCAELRDKISDGSLTRPEAARPLALFQTELDRLPADQAQRRAKEKLVGQTPLRWLWDQHDDLGFNDETDNRLVYFIMDLVVNEDREEMIWEWITSCHSAREYTADYIRYDWRGQALLGLVRAKAKDMNGSLDEALRTFFRGIAFQVDSGFPLPEALTSTFLQRQLTHPMPVKGVSEKMITTKKGFITPEEEYDRGTLQPRYPETSPDLWQKFHDYVGIVGSVREMAHARQAAMWLLHPKTPDPFPIVRLLKHADLDRSVRALRDRHASAFFWANCKSASRLLMRSGKHDEAEYVMAAASRLFNKPRKDSQS